ncbi:hypothetical protein CPB85DRAFT_23622 [Mucidula mucida]|nr:hypothetical protein CPB85DRAFT_23622 [Mucidula mucida]
MGVECKEVSRAALLATIMSTGIPTFPNAQQAQIIRAHQRDVYHLSALRDQTETVLRSWLGTRWLSRRDKEIDLLVKCLYFGMTVGRGMQTLGEEYTNIWQYSGASGLLLPVGCDSVLFFFLLYLHISLPEALLGCLPLLHSSNACLRSLESLSK